MTRVRGLWERVSGRVRKHFMAEQGRVESLWMVCAATGSCWGGSERQNNRTAPGAPHGTALTKHTHTHSDQWSSLSILTSKRTSLRTFVIPEKHTFTRIRLLQTPIAVSSRLTTFQLTLLESSVSSSPSKEL